MRKMFESVLGWVFRDAGSPVGTARDIGGA